MFFPPAGITVGALLTTSRRRWPPVLAAAVCGELAMDQANGLGLAESIGFMAANGLEPLAGAALVRWAVAGRLDLTRVRHLVGYLGGAVIGGPALGAALGAAAAGGFGDNGYVSTAWQWWLGRCPRCAVGGHGDRRLEGADPAAVRPVGGPGRTGGGHRRGHRRHPGRHRPAAVVPGLVLPPEFQTGRAFEASGLCIAATTELGVGGDWYESTDLPDGRVFVAVGDIVGHGAVAAASMGRLRMLANVCAVEASDAADLLRRLELRAGWMVDVFASTAWFGLFDPTTRLLSFASAGHLPAYLVDPEAGPGLVRQLVCAPNVSLLVQPDGPKLATEAILPVGATLVVYTDGLIERRGESLDDEVARLEAALHSLGEGPVRPGQVLDAVRAGSAVSSDDDTIVLTVTFP